MNDLNDIIGASDLFEDESLRLSVLQDSLPASLVALVGIEQIMDRVPVAYQRAIFSMHLSSRFFYENGASADPLKFYRFMKQYGNGQ
jgi:glutamate dehydrogenase